MTPAGAIIGRLGALAAAVLLAAAAGNSAGPRRVVGAFSAPPGPDGLPAGWEVLTFERVGRRTRYRVVETEDGRVLRADSRASASGLVRRVRIDPRAFPRIRWRWKVENVYVNGDVRRKSGDDYPARVYVLFAYDPERASWPERLRYEAARAARGSYPPWRAVNYIWASRAPVGTMVPNPYNERAMMIAIQSGRDRLGAWVEQERNVYADYRRAFGEEPPPIEAVAVMTDSDDTGEAGTAFYGDIVFLPGP